MSKLLEFEDALQEIQQSALPKAQQHTIALTKASGKILAADVIANCFVPPHDNSAMDGYAFTFDDWQEGKALTVSQRIPAGTPPEPLTPHTCARIFTGANIPKGADTVVMQENTELQGDKVVFKRPSHKGDNVRAKGQDILSGQTIMKAGDKITPIHIGLLSSLGITEVLVYSTLRVGIMTTGDELIPAGNPLKAGQIFNSNGPMLAALVEQAGYEVSPIIHVPDSPEKTESALLTLIETCDVILSSGGVSVGEEDHVKGVLEKLGEVHLWKIAIKPGKPLVHATIKGVPFLGLPGNPSSTLVTYHWFARLLLSICSGQKTALPQPYPVDAGFSREKTIKRDEFLRVSIGDDGLAHAHSQQSSGALLAACESHGYLHIKANTSIEYGCSYPFYPFSSF